MRHDDKRKLYNYFNEIENKTEKEEELFMILGLSLDEYDITSVSKDDLEEIGFDTENVDSKKMEAIAYRMANAYTDDVFWDDLREIAEAEGLEEQWSKLDIEDKFYIANEWFDEATGGVIIESFLAAGIELDWGKMTMKQLMAYTEEMWNDMSMEEAIGIYEEAKDKGIA